MVIDPIPPSLQDNLSESSFVSTYALTAAYPFVNDDYTAIRFGKPIRINWDAGPDSAVDLYRVTIRDAHGQAECITCCREFRYDDRLFGSVGTGRVAFRLSLHVIQEGHRGKGIGRTLHMREEEFLFSRWGAQEIHVQVKKLGFVAWTNPSFGYEIAPHRLLFLVAEFRRVFGDSHPEVNEIGSIKDFPSVFWKWASEQPPTFQSLFFKKVEH
jgi:hypothetical protein